MSDLRDVPGGEGSELEAEAPREDSELENLGFLLSSHRGDGLPGRRGSVPAPWPPGTHFLVAYSGADSSSL